MLLKNSFLSFAMMLICFGLKAQQDKLITHFIYDKMSINPGKTGIDLYNGICATSIYRNQWDKINGAPNSAVLNIEANLTKYFPGGVGIAFYHDAIGFARQNNVLLNYSYPIQIGRAGVLGIGVGLGIMNYGLNPDWVPPTNNPDPTLPVGFAATSFDANFGLYFNGKDFYGGISSTHLSASLLQQSVAGFSQSYQTARHYYIMGGKRFKKIGPGDIDAQVLLRTEFVKFSADINARYILDLPGKKQIYGGFTYRTSDAVALMVGYTPIPKMTVGYSYDLTINKLSSISRGSHELVVKYCYYLPPPPKQRARHPRWL
ncbi:MAG: type IX secretion system membrane protein PorP/SprF [Flavobacteriales bacterium]|nr:type IX secretion system membrane protein PorP/SprF [Flavobacteriales bacterium]NCA19630.1 type IX secretion system membrane protein PorP/SprF [Crocinitomicaceae bacterium]